MRLVQESPDLVLEGQRPAEFSFNMPKNTCLEVSSNPEGLYFGSGV